MLAAGAAQRHAFTVLTTGNVRALLALQTMSECDLVANPDGLVILLAPVVRAVLIQGCVELADLQPAPGPRPGPSAPCPSVRLRPPASRP